MKQPSVLVNVYVRFAVIGEQQPARGVTAAAADANTRYALLGMMVRC
jgi:hypothetical protein